MTRTDFTQLRHGSDLIKRGFARMQQGGVIMDVVDAEQAAVAEDAGAVAVMALERVPADIRKACLLYTSPSPRDVEESRMPSSA